MFVWSIYFTQYRMKAYGTINKSNLRTSLLSSGDWSGEYHSYHLLVETCLSLPRMLIRFLDSECMAAQQVDVFPGMSQNFSTAIFITRNVLRIRQCSMDSPRRHKCVQSHHPPWNLLSLLVASSAVNRWTPDW